jgi:hypothetical protein
MRILVFIRVLMVAAMDGNPLEKRPFHSHRSQHRKRSLQWQSCLKGFMREKPVIANGDAQAGQDIHAQEQPQVYPAKTVTPQENRRSDQPSQWQRDGHDVSDALAKSLRLWLLGFLF